MGSKTEIDGSELRPDAFQMVVEDEFSFLQDDFGFERQQPKMRAPETSVTFRCGDREIVVQNELGSGPWVELSRVDEVGGRERFDLTFLLLERSPKDAREIWELIARGYVTEAIACQAEGLRRFGADILAGDYSVLPGLRQRARRRARERQAELFGSTAPGEGRDE